LVRGISRRAVHLKARRLAPALILIGLLGLPAVARGDTPAPDAADTRVTTLAGDGLPGLRDGPASQAEFLEPVGIAAGARGELLVADASAQRIRRIDANGRVSTIAGSGAVDASGLYVPGGFRDGPVASAQFDQPSGVALASDGAILVADRLNHCVRRIADGTVTTYAGNAAAAGNADGDRASARFYAPLALAFDRAGNLFVADFGNGVREVDVSGRVSTVSLPKGRGLLATSVATAVEAGHDVLLVALQSGIARLDLTAGQTSFFAAGLAPPGSNSDSAANVFMEAGPNLGTAYGVAPFGEGRFIYTDLRNHAIRVVWGRQARVLAGSNDGDASYTAGTYRDGPGQAARFYAPLGIARIGAARFAVADSGDRRVRLVAVHTAPAQRFEDLVAAKTFYRIVYIGNSFVDYDGDDRTSIAALLEAALRARAGSLGLRRPPRLFTVKLIADAPAIGGFIRNYFPGVADLVIWQVNSAELSGFESVPGGLGAEIAPRIDVWRPVLLSELRATRDALANERTAFLAVLNPMPWQISPVESAYQRLYDLPVPAYESGRNDGLLMRDALAHSGVEVLDLFPAFATAERAARPAAEFASLDHHFSESGRRLVANEIASRLFQSKPWSAAH
jgi:hypothetical protein